MGKPRSARRALSSTLACAVLVAASLGVVAAPVSAFGSLSDDAVAVWQHRDSATSPTGWDIYYTFFGQATLGPFAPHAAGGAAAAAIATIAGDDKNPHVGANAGVTIAVWQHAPGTGSTPGDWDIFYSQFSVVDGSPTWTTPAAIASLSGDDYDPNITVDSNGTAVAVWVHREGSGARNMYYSVLNGTSWSAATILGASGGQASLPEVSITSVASAGGALAHRAVAAWSDVISGTHRMFASTFDGLTWTTPVQIESSATAVGVSIGNVGFANYVGTDPDPFGAFGRLGVTGDGGGNAFVVWGGGPVLLGLFSPGVVGAILNVAANTWAPMLTPVGSRFIGVGGCENPDAALTTGGGDFVGVFDFNGLIEHTRRVGGAFTVEAVSYNTVSVNDQRPSNAAVSATKLISVNWGAPVGPGSQVIWSVGTLVGTSAVSWTSAATIALAGEDMFPEIASGFAATLITGFTLTPGTDTNPMGTPHTVTATLTVNGVPQAGATINFSVTGANSASGSGTTNSSGQATFTYTGTNAGNDTITATTVVGGQTLTATATKTWVRADTVPPVTTATVSPAPNAAGWNNTVPVMVTFSAEDFAPAGVTPSGVASITVTLNAVPVPCTATGCTVTLTADGHYHFMFHATDNAGNVEASQSLDVMIDTTAPLITGTPSPGPNAAGWNNTDVTKTYACTDEPIAIASGIASCQSPITISAEGVHTVVGTAMDLAGNTATDTETIKIDQTKPAVGCVPTTNPSGKHIPNAGNNPKSGQNPDGFYMLTAKDEGSGLPTLAIFVKDSASTFVAGPYADGTKIKLVQAPGVTPNVKPGAGVIDWMIQLKGDAIVEATDLAGTTATTSCLVPPPPK